MNKKQLIEALEAYPDHAEILVSVGGMLARIDRELDYPTLAYFNNTNNAKVFAVSGDPTYIVLEL